MEVLIINHYVYEITNKVNNKKYIGKRSCNCDIKEDDYMGSGLFIVKAIKKYGIENFKKEIIYIAETEEEALSWEKYIIQRYKIAKDKKYYNIASGGNGGNVFEGYSEQQKIEYSKKISKVHANEKNSMYGRKHTDFMTEEEIQNWKNNIKTTMIKISK